MHRNNIIIVSFNNYTDGCEEDSEQRRSGCPNAIWPESNIGPQSIPCPCGNIVTNQRAYRECRGDFITQALWRSGPSNFTECDVLDCNLCLISGV